MNLQVLDKRNVFNKEFKVYGTPEEPLFLARDVAEWIEHSNSTEMVRGVDDDEKLNSTILTSGQNREMTFLTEDGLYEVLMQSRKPIAKKFKKKVKEILKDIRKHGMYAKDELLDNPDLLLDVIQKYKEEREEKLLLENKIALDKPKVLFAEAVENSEDVILVKEMALILTQHGFKVGQNQLFEYLRKYEYLCKKLGDMYNLPTKKYEHLFKVTKRVMQGTKGAFTTNTPKITGRGQMYFVKKFAEYKLSGLTIKDLLVDKSIEL